MCDPILRLVHIFCTHVRASDRSRITRVRVLVSSRLDALEIDPEEEREEEIRTRWRPMDDARRSLNRQASSRYVAGPWVPSSTIDRQSHEINARKRGLRRLRAENNEKRGEGEREKKFEK